MLLLFPSRIYLERRDEGWGESDCVLRSGWKRKDEFRSCPINGYRKVLRIAITALIEMTVTCRTDNPARPERLLPVYKGGSQAWRT